MPITTRVPSLVLLAAVLFLLTVGGGCSIDFHLGEGAPDERGELAYSDLYGDEADDDSRDREPEPIRLDTDIDLLAPPATGAY